jgi:ribosomal-protein-alanine N-acetyltransferase
MIFGRRHTADGVTTLAPYRSADRRTVLTLMSRAECVHTHLDWYETDDWLNLHGTIIWCAWRGGHLIGVLGFGESMNAATWIRLAVFNSAAESAHLFDQLWERAAAELRAAHVRQVAILIVHEWLQDCLRPLAFRPFDQVVTLRRAAHPLPPFTVARISLLPFTPAHLGQVIAIDQTAFSAPWQMSADEIRQAERMASSLTLATLPNGRAVGYQLSTLYFDGAHLARLAVLPEAQGNGIGRALVSDLIHRFARRSVYTITVNTQATNIQSQRVYTRLGFERTGYDLPVYLLDLADTPSPR